MTLSCIIADDEPMARNGIAGELKEIEFVELVGVAANAVQAREMLATLRPDLLLLDIGMPGLSGLELIRLLPERPMIIIITAYPEHALESYELNIMDYLIKPVGFDRLLKACQKAADFHALKWQTQYFFVKQNGRHEKVLFNELLFVEAADNYVLIHTTTRKIMVYDTMKNMETMLPAAVFMRTHKSFIVSLDKVSGMDGLGLSVRAEGHNREYQVPVSRNLKEAVLERVLRR